jgi:hypothetical protein
VVDVIGGKVVEFGVICIQAKEVAIGFANFGNMEIVAHLVDELRIINAMDLIDG